MEAADSVTVNCSDAVPVLPSFTRLLDTLSVGSVGVGVGVGVGVVASSSRIVPVAAALVSVALVGLLSLRANVSVDSAVVSRLTSTVTTFCVSPEANVSVPDVAV